MRTREQVCALLKRMAGELDTSLTRLSIEAGRNQTYLQQFITKGTPKSLPEDVREFLARRSGLPVDEFRVGGIDSPRTTDILSGSGEARFGAAGIQNNKSGDPDREVVFIPELDVQVSAGGGVVVDTETIIGQWPMSKAYVQFFLGVDNTSGLVIVEIKGDSMVPTLNPGDRVIINTIDTLPTPPGIFAVWDGLGLVVKRVQHIPNSSPTTYRLISDNPIYEPYEMAEEDSRIIGRAVWKAQRM